MKKIKAKNKNEKPENNSALIDADELELRMIRQLLKLPPEKRLNFLRVPLADGGSAL